MYVFFNSGIKHVLVALMAQKAEVKYDPSYIFPSQIANKIQDLGFGTSLLDSESMGQSTVELNVSKICLISSLF